ncbi:MAG: tRNA 2-thiouridine(34) synthase MnmA [Chlamydiales bacterium]|nr:tRNA 2-thiouridine(34) synthase MnmA [Chlamydiia bacterium]MCP5507072.1 tRNA 2-thiouridine(34) synthase MnmA [Chlamydiales bacterium]
MSSLPAKTVVIGMSGGVDSSVAALLLKQQGYRVIGLFMRNWDENDPSGNCQASVDYDDVVRVCKQIDIPHYAVDFTKEYWDQVFAHFLDEYRAGHTPNPDILCNREIKFKVLLDKAFELGADFLATGHYVQKRQAGEECQLLRGADQGKDQSYFLYAIDHSALEKSLYPIGHLPKAEVRRIAAEHGLATSEKKDSTGICFIGERNFKEFLSNYIAAQPGEFVTLDGDVVGKHDGIAYYTIGQRRGMGIGGPGDAWFVVGKDIPNNRVIVAQGSEHPALFCDELTATEITWISPKGAPSVPFTCTARVRYRQPDQPCTITTIDDDRMHVVFHVPQRAVTPRQSVVFYDGDVCLGGAVIEKAGPSHYDQKK